MTKRKIVFALVLAEIDKRQGAGDRGKERYKPFVDESTPALILSWLKLYHFRVWFFFPVAYLFRLICNYSNPITS
jgi:hypothetical protein